MAKFRRRQRDALGPDLSSLDTTLKQVAFAEVYVQVRSSFQGARQIFLFLLFLTTNMPMPRGTKQRAVQPSLPLPNKRPADPDYNILFAQDTNTPSPGNGKRRAVQPVPPRLSESDDDTSFDAAFAQRTTTTARTNASLPPVGESSRDAQILDILTRKMEAKNAHIMDQLNRTSLAQEQVTRQLQARLASQATTAPQAPVHAAPAAEPSPVQANHASPPAPVQPQVPLHVSLAPPPTPIADIVRAAEAKTERLIRQTQDVYMAKLPNKTAFVATKGQSLQMNEIIELFDHMTTATTTMEPQQALTYMNEFIALLKSKLARTVQQSDFQAAIAAKCDIYGHRFAEHAKTALISGYNGDYTHGIDALADAAKACRQDDKSGPSGWREYRPPLPPRSRNDRTQLPNPSSKQTQL